MACFFTRRAEDDLEAIGDYIALDNPVRAVSFVQEIRARCESILDAPKGYPLVPRYGAGVRKVAFGRYLILYTLNNAEEVIILHIPAAAQDTLL
jgi:toxin ParE1/3/4